jgi:hypothetical protein
MGEKKGCRMILENSKDPKKPQTQKEKGENPH